MAGDPGLLRSEAMSGSTVRAVALDYDGTVTEASRPDQATLDALASARHKHTLLLVTGRILTELRADFPDVDQHFDMIVAENGAVLSRGTATRNLTPPVDPRLGLALAHRGVPLRHGRILLACDAVYEATVRHEIKRLGLGCQVIRNRAALMVLPAGVTKATGVLAGLAEFEISRHSTVAVGNAENDTSLLEACGVGIAVADAVQELKDHADVVLDEPNGEGVRELLDGPILTGRQRVHSRRWQIELGTDAEGAPVRIPANQVNALVIGASGTGKSYASGLLTEQLLRLGYTVLVLDAAGEHRALGDLDEALTLGGSGEPLPPPERVGELLGHHVAGLVLDLSALPDPARNGYLEHLSGEVAERRSQTGLPHWVVMEEAHLLAGGVARPLADESGLSHCLATYHPMELCPSLTADMDVVIATPGGGDGHEQTVAFLADFSGEDEDEVDKALADAPGRGALVVRRDAPGELLPVFLAAREVGHVRHKNKYAEAGLPEHLRFYFYAGDGAPGPVAGNIAEFRDVLSACDDRFVAYHAPRRDFSRWIYQVLADGRLGDEVAEIERVHHDDPDAVRDQVLQAVETRYLL